jgi:hypothetical protein
MMTATPLFIRRSRLSETEVVPARGQTDDQISVWGERNYRIMVGSWNACAPESFYLQAIL